VGAFNVHTIDESSNRQSPKKQTLANERETRMNARKRRCRVITFYFNASGVYQQPFRFVLGSYQIPPGQEIAKVP